MKRITLTQPDDLHCHFRDDVFLATTVAHTAKQFARAIAMPNTKPPITTTEAAEAYRRRILAAKPAECDFTPLMTLYLTDNTPAHEIKKAKDSGVVFAVKYYPAGATTNSDYGVSDIRKTFNVLEALQDQDMPLLVHGEVTTDSVDIFDREKTFIDNELSMIVKTFPDLKVVLEHITTEDAVAFVAEQSERVAATITVHHLTYNRNHMLVGGIKPHFYCLPIIKRNTHTKALVKAATSGNPKFFLGTDSAPHIQSTKENACGCAGIYTAHAALELYAEIFEAQNALDKLEAFASHFGADFYGLARNKGSVTLEKQNWTVPASYPFGDEVVVPMKAQETLTWKCLPT